MAAPVTGNVQIPQSTIDGWTSTITSVSATISTEATNLGTYIQQLIAAANAGTPLPAATVTNIETSLSNLQTAAGALPVPPAPSAPVPTVTAVADTTSGGAGADAGGDSVTVTGTGFFGGGTAAAVSAVNFGTVPATSVTVESDTSLTAVSPAGTSGSTVDVTVVTPAGTSAVNSGDQFTYA
jgi:large repetitive protein